MNITTVWLLVASVLSMLTTVGVGLYYMGLARVKSVLNMGMLMLGGIVTTCLVWVLWAWSLAFGGSDVAGVVGNPASGFLLRDSIALKNGAFLSVMPTGASYPRLADVLFEMTVACLAVVLISGALAERIKFSAWAIFVVFWVSIVYAPVAHMLWSRSGLLSATGPLSQALGSGAHDLAGSGVVWLSAAVSALAIVLIIGRRRNFHVTPLKPHSLTLSFCGVALAFVGFMGFVAGHVHSGNGTAVYTVLSMLLACSASCWGWLMIDRLRNRHFTALGAISGILSGMAAVCAAADSLNPLWTVLIGFIAGVACSSAVSWKYRLNYDDSFDVVAIAGVGAVIGLLANGLFAQKGGLLTGGGVGLLVAELVEIVVVFLWAGVWTAVIAFVLEKTVGWRIADRDEVLGVDIADQGEKGYDFETFSNSVFKEAQ